MPPNNIFFVPILPTADYICLINNNNKIVLPFANSNSSIPFYKTFDIDKEKKEIILFLYTLPIKTKFWDFSNITTQYDKKYSTYNADSIKLNEDKKYKILLSFSCNNEGKVSDIDSSYFIKNLCTDDVKKELYYTLLNDKTIQNIEKNTTEKPLD